MIIAERETSGATRRAVLLVVLLRKVQGIMSSMGIMGESEFALGTSYIIPINCCL